MIGTLSLGGPSQSNNDVGGLTANQIRLFGLSPFTLTGDAITLGGGGLSVFNSTSPPFNGGAPALWTPLILGAPQTWTFTDVTPANAPFDEPPQLQLHGGLSGSGDALTVNLSDGTLDLSAHNDVGTIQVIGTNNVNGLEGSVMLDPGSDLNATDGNPVTLRNAYIGAHDASTGPLTIANAFMTVGAPFGDSSPPGSLRVASATFDSRTFVTFDVSGTGAISGTNFGQLTSTGTVDLGSSTLSVQCSGAPLGTAYTVVSTTGGLIGQFADAPGGVPVPNFCDGEYRIDYNRTGPVQTVTATIVALPPTTKASLSATPSNPQTNEPVTLTAVVASSSEPAKGVASVIDYARSGSLQGCSLMALNGSGATQATSCHGAFAAGLVPLFVSFFPVGISPPPAFSPVVYLTVRRGSTTTALRSTSRRSDRATFTAVVAPRYVGAIKPSGRVEFFDHGKPVRSCGRAPMMVRERSSSATCVLRRDRAHSHRITARYLGDKNFLGSRS